MKEYHNVELLTIHNECDVVIEEIITKHIETFNIEACTSEKIYKKVIIYIVFYVSLTHLLILFG